MHNTSYLGLINKFISVSMLIFAIRSHWEESGQMVMHEDIVSLINCLALKKPFPLLIWDYP